MRCPRCGSENCSILNESVTSGSDYGVCKGVCGWAIFGPIGLLCGLCGEGSTTRNTNYWVCNTCGRKWKV